MRFRVRRRSRMTRRSVFDVLVKYLWNPWTALYVGYTSSTREFQEPDPVDPIFLDLEDEGRQFFVKFSYLFQL